jgi:four helix bundle protein
MANDHHDLIVWKRSIKLVKAIYSLTKKFPKEELYALTNQIRRASVSVPSNLAEGHAMKTTTHYIKFIYIARGSLAELETQLIISRELDYITTEEFKPIHGEITNLSRMLTKMIGSLNKKMELNNVWEEIREAKYER